jgi:hypothetical protein
MLGRLMRGSRDDGRPQWPGQIVPHAGEGHQLRSGDGGGQSPATLNPDERVVFSVHHERRHVHVGEVGSTVAGGEVGRALAPARARVDASSLEHATANLAQPRLVKGIARRADHSVPAHHQVREALRGAGAAGAQAGEGGPNRRREPLAADPPNGVEEIQVSVRILAGWRIAIVWATIPPSERSTMCALSQPSASSTLMASSAMSSNRYTAAAGRPGSQPRPHGRTQQALNLSYHP